MTIKVGDSVKVIDAIAYVSGKSGVVTAINDADSYPYSVYLQNGSLRLFKEDELEVTSFIEETWKYSKDNPSSDEEFEAKVEQVFEEAKKLLLKKHHDYGPENISRSPGGPLNGLRVRMHDKQARINNLIDSGAEPENESLRDSFLDLANYGIIALLVLDESWPI